MNPNTPQIPTKPAPNKDKKKLFLIVGAIGAVVLLALIGFIVYSATMAVSKEDYAAAMEQYNDVSAANRSLTLDVSSLSSSTTASDERFNKAAQEVEAAITNVKTENEALGQLKAVRVGEGKELYDTFNDKLQAYLAYGDELLISIKNVRPALAACNAVGESTQTAARVSALNACSESFNQVGDIPNAEFKSFIDAVKTQYTELAAAYETLAGITDPYGDQYDEYRAARDKVFEVQDGLREATTTLSEAIEAKDNEMSVRDEANALAGYLNEQQQ